jgi:hypothetical protein
VTDIGEESRNLLRKYKFALYLYLRSCVISEKQHVRNAVFFVKYWDSVKKIQEHLKIPPLTVIFTNNTLFFSIIHPYYSPFKTLVSDNFTKLAPCLTPQKIVGTAISNEPYVLLTAFFYATFCTRTQLRISTNHLYW